MEIELILAGIYDKEQKHPNLIKPVYNIKKASEPFMFPLLDDCLIINMYEMRC